MVSIAIWNKHTHKSGFFKDDQTCTSPKTRRIELLCKSNERVKYLFRMCFVCGSEHEFAFA